MSVPPPAPPGSVVRRGRAALAAALAWAAAACAARQPAPRAAPVDAGGAPALCALDRRAERATAAPADGGAPRALRAETWFALLVRGYDPATRRVADAPRDCTGAPVAWDDAAGAARDCVEPAPDARPEPPRPLGDEDLVLTRAGGGRQLVWAITRRLSDGDAEGVVALAEVSPRAVRVRAVGTLRARPQRARLRLVEVGGRELLVAEGEACGDPNDVTTCRRAVRLVPRVGDRFVARPLALRDGRCVGPAAFELAREDTAALASGWTRRFAATTAMRFGAGAVVAHEQVVVLDADPAHPAVPPRPFRVADDERTVEPAADGRLIVSDSSLWLRVHRSAGSVAPSPR